VRAWGRGAHRWLDTRKDAWKRKGGALAMKGSPPSVMVVDREAEASMLVAGVGV
jgi:hypothetical protein